MLLTLFSSENIAETSLWVDIIGLSIVIAVTFFTAHRSKKFTLDRDSKNIFNNKKDKTEVQIKTFKYKAVQYLCSEYTQRSAGEEYSLLSLSSEIEQNISYLLSEAKVDIQDIDSEIAMKFYNLMYAQLTDYEGFRNNNRKQLSYNSERVLSVEEMSKDLLFELSKLEK